MAGEAGPRNSISQKVQIYANLAFYGIVGCLIRMGLNSLTAFEYGGILWANVCGCVIMGLHPSLFPEEMHVLIGTGLCGSITSFSSLIVQLFSYSVDRTPAWNNAGYGVMAFLSFTIIQFSCCFTALVFGHHLRVIVRPLGPGIYRYTRFIWVFAAAGWVTSLICAICIKNGRNWTLAVVFAPTGVWARYFLSRYNTPTLKRGTFTVNIAGTVVSAICTLFLHQNFLISRTQRVTLHALMDGFSGNLSTISTFINELFTMPRKAAYIYFCVSVGTGYILALLLIGPNMWVHK